MAFGKATPYEFDTAITRLKNQNAKAFVLDLRNDGGGYVDSALLISRRFVANKALLTVEERGNHATTIDAGNENSVTIPVTILVNQYTASASEITAGALQDDGVGTLVGVKTFGKGVMQTLTQLRMERRSKSRRHITSRRAAATSTSAASNPTSWLPRTRMRVTATSTVTRSCALRSRCCRRRSRIPNRSSRRHPERTVRSDALAMSS